MPGRPAPARAMTFAGDGARHFPSVLDAAAVAGLLDAVRDLPEAPAGVRVHGIEALRPFLAATGPVGVVAASIASGACRPVRAVVFDKTAAANWSLRWHQDRTIAVAGGSKSTVSDPGPSRAACSTSRRPSRSCDGW